MKQRVVGQEARVHNRFANRHTGLAGGGLGEETRQMVQTRRKVAFGEKFIEILHHSTPRRERGGYEAANRKRINRT
ncbi:protein of unknown function (plasmid) [Shinella sp. WSC3-e]|nr:hypothetical protein SHINE37_100087 [Rhizobiaceae bacterium]CAK7261629.1 protein of unknown function [Shinella sp. WSC3-e]